MSGSGFLANTTVVLVSCAEGTTNGFDCDLGGLPGADTNASGSFSTSFTVRRDILVRIGGEDVRLDCAVDRCVIGVGDLGQVRTASAPISFRNVPRPSGTITVTPSEGLVEGQLVQVTGSDFDPGQTVSVRQCAPTTVLAQCDSTHTKELAADETGAFTTGFAVVRDVVKRTGGVATLRDCAVETCTIGAGASFPRKSAFAPIGLADVSHPVPSLTATTDGNADFGTAAITGVGSRRTPT